MTVWRIVVDVDDRDVCKGDANQRTAQVADLFMAQIAPTFDLKGLSIGKPWARTSTTSGMIQPPARRYDPETGEVIVR